MQIVQKNRKPLISVVITCYNQGVFLKEAIESAISQDYPEKEVIVVNDGSTDQTEPVAQQFKMVRYICQKNSGLSAARNTGVEQSKGEYIVFLDADDWLLPGALSTNLKYLEANREAAFVAGAHIKTDREKRIIEQVDKGVVTGDPYAHLLIYNYIEMHAAVMYRHWVFSHFRFDPSLRACEDYDLYLKISRKFPIIQHTHLIAAYRKHNENMSVNIPLMIGSGLSVKRRQQKLLKSEYEREQFQKGIEFWKDYYCDQLDLRLSNKSAGITMREAFMLLKYKKHLLFRYFKKRLKSLAKNRSPQFLLKLLYHAGVYKSYASDKKKVDWGDLNRLTPFSTTFGYDRGGPVDRYYIENFLKANAHLIRGRVLEIADNEYTRHFGGANVWQSDILHVDGSNPKATFTGDLSNAPHLPADAFDCIVLTQTLHLIYHYKRALQTCYRILKPGGVLLLTVPGISQIDQGEWKKAWLWSFTSYSVSEMMAEVFPPANVQVDTYGNVFIATAFLYGLGLPEVNRQQLDFRDEHYQVIITAKAFK